MWFIKNENVQFLKLNFCVFIEYVIVLGLKTYLLKKQWKIDDNLSSFIISDCNALLDV